MEDLSRTQVVEHRIHRFTLGDVAITRIVELEGPVPGPIIIPQATRENVRTVTTLSPGFVTPEGDLNMAIHAFVVESRGKRILVDTCVGNGKTRLEPSWHDLSGPFLDDLGEAGFARETIDFVLCTHLHTDHVGWNTIKVDGRWVPTFPNARYLFARTEWEFWNTLPGDLAAQVGMDEVLNDSIRPIVEAGLADFVEPDHAITDEVSLEPTPGHTPGHVSVRIRSGGAEGVITGDLMHHPVQIARPDWGCAYDSDSAAAEETRRRFVIENAARPVRVFGTHFATPSVGRIVRHGDAYGFET